MPVVGAAALLLILRLFQRIIKFIYMCTYYTHIWNHLILREITHVHNGNSIVWRCECLYAHSLSRQTNRWIALPMDTGNRILCVRVFVLRVLIDWSANHSNHLASNFIVLLTEISFLLFVSSNLLTIFRARAQVTAHKNVSTSVCIMLFATVSACYRCC